MPIMTGVDRHQMSFSSLEDKITVGNKAILKFKGIRTNSKGYTKKTFRNSESDCKNCPLREQCCGKVSKFKKLDESHPQTFV